VQGLGDRMAMAESSVTNVTDTYTSHCWEPDGSFHIVCIFVILVSSCCFFITVLSVYRIFKLISSSFSENEDFNESIKMYKLQPVSSESDVSVQRSLVNPNTIETVESVECRVREEQCGTDCIC